MELTWLLLVLDRMVETLMDETIFCETRRTTSIRFDVGLGHASLLLEVSSGRTTDWFKGKGDALNYTEEEWYELLHEADRIDGMITECWNVMGESDRTRPRKAGRR
jgi:alpha-N-arabinofuranosidase